VEPYRILMVCMGNICRSPTAEVVLRVKLQAAGLAERVLVESAGTHGHWHAGQGAEHRATRHAAQRGYDLSAHRARAVRHDDAERHALILAMDWENLVELGQRWPDVPVGRIRRLSEFARKFVEQEFVPDPYTGGPEDFERVLDLVEDACDGLVQALPRQVPGLSKGTS
jgi:protein-tyrosine phosphatase